MTLPRWALRLVVALAAAATAAMLALTAFVLHDALNSWSTALLMIAVIVVIAVVLAGAPLLVQRRRERRRAHSR